MIAPLALPLFPCRRPCSVGVRFERPGAEQSRRTYHCSLLSTSKARHQDGRDDLSSGNYFATWMPGGCQVPSPAGSIEGASVFGQYRRITR